MSIESIFVTRWGSIGPRVLFGRGSLPLSINFEAALPDSAALTLIDQQGASHQRVCSVNLSCHRHTLISVCALGNRKTLGEEEKLGCDTAEKQVFLGLKNTPKKRGRCVGGV